MKKTKTLVASLIALVLCFTMVIGTTFAWFTDSVTNTNTIITSGNVDVELWHCDFNGSLPIGFGYFEENGKQVDESTKLFLNVEGNDILWEPGASARETFRIKNVGSLAFKYEFRVKVLNKTTTLDDKSLTDVVKLQAVELEYLENNIPVGTDGVDDENVDFTNGYVIAGELLSGEYVDYFISLDWFSTENDNDYANLKMNVGIELVATQLTYENDGTGSDYDKNAQFPEITYVDKLDGEPSIAWYLENPEAEEFTLTSAEDFAGLQQLVDGTAAIPSDVADKITFPVTFVGQTITLNADIDLYKENENGEPISFDPIGSYRNDQAFKGVFDGNGHTISNLSQNTWALNNGYYYEDLGLGLFGLVEDATIKNLVIDGAEISGETAICGTVAACAYGDCTFEDITIKNAKVADYEYYAGGVVGWASGNHVYKNINIDESNVIAGQWGDFNNANGGIIGGVGGSAEILIKDSVVACRIDAFNDVTSAYEWYSYRNSGMIIGSTGKKGDNNIAIAPQLTCENVTVIYGDWANYHYCKFSAMKYPWVRVEAGTSTGVYSNPRYGHPIDANGNEVVDDNHVHNDGEAHNELIVFDQLYGGATDARNVTYGNPVHEGVTVIYYNK